MYRWNKWFFLSFCLACSAQTAPHVEERDAASDAEAGMVDGGDPDARAKDARVVIVDGNTCLAQDEACNGADDDCDSEVDEGLDTDHGSFAGCKNYRLFIDRALDAQLKNQSTKRFVVSPSSYDGHADWANVGFVGRGELLRALQGVAMPSAAATRQSIAKAAMQQAEGFIATEASTDWAQEHRIDKELMNGTRGWFASTTSAKVSMYTTGPTLLGFVLLAEAIYEDSTLTAYRTDADKYMEFAGEVIDWWLHHDSLFHSSTDSVAVRQNWVCELESTSSCTLESGARAVKWNKQTWFWRAVGAWTDVSNKHRQLGSTYRLTRAVRFTRWMKKDMTDSSGPWSEAEPYIWHAWADAPTSYPYIEDASHGSWDVGLMFEAWRRGWVDTDNEDAALMGPGSASRFRHTYMDNLAIAADACVGNYVNGEHKIVGHRHYGIELRPGRRRALTEWIGMANGNIPFLQELHEDITGSCDGNVLTSYHEHMILHYARMIAELRKVRKE